MGLLLPPEKGPFEAEPSSVIKKLLLRVMFWVKTLIFNAWDSIFNFNLLMFAVLSTYDRLMFTVANGAASKTATTTPPTKIAINTIAPIISGSFLIGFIGTVGAGGGAWDA
jgi:hypothetical protein